MTERFNWRDRLAVHPAADLFPRMSEDELRELGENIKANGLTSSIVLYKGKLLDGRNRLDAMELVGISFGFMRGTEGSAKNKLCYLHACDGSNIFEGMGGRIDHLLGKGGTFDHINGDPYAFVLSTNLHRRHLTGEQKRELIAKVLKAKPAASNRQIAKQTKADDKTVAKVRADLESRSEIPNVDARTDTKGRKQPAKRKGKAAASKSPPKLDAAPEPEPDSVTTPHVTGSAEVSVEQRRAEYTALDGFPDDLAVEQFKTKLDDFLSDFESTLAMWLDEHPDLESNGSDVLIEVLEHHALKLTALGRKIASAAVAVLQ